MELKMVASTNKTPKSIYDTKLNFHIFLHMIQFCFIIYLFTQLNNLKNNNLDLIKDGYELMKELSRGKKISKEDLHHLIDKIDIPSEERQALKNLTPSSYVGIAKTLAKQLKDG